MNGFHNAYALKVTNNYCHVRKMVQSHPYLRYCHKSGTIVLSIQTNIKQAGFLFACMIFAKDGLFEHEIILGAGLDCKQTKCSAC